MRLGMAGRRDTLAGLVCAGLLVTSGSTARAQPITIGPYSFPDESPFADTADYQGDYEDYQWDPPIWAGGGEHVLTGFSPESNRSNLGLQPDSSTCAPNRELVDFGFTDVVAVNGPGADIVIFDVRLSADHYEVAVRPVGGTFTSFHFYMAADQRPTGWSDQPGRELWGVDIELSDYGIAPGVPVDRVRVAGDCRTAPPHPSRGDVPWAELDPAMAAVLNRPCACDDGDPCTFDCDPTGACGSTPHDPGTPCSGGVCDGEASPACVECVDDAQCPAERPRCDLAANACVECLAEADCDDEDECTVDSCEAGQCANPPAPAGSPCAGGMCDGEPEPSCVACLDHTDCDDALECTLDECVDAECQSTAAARGTPCESGFCNGDVSAPRCLPCLSNADCDEVAPFCTGAGLCVECRGPRDCPTNECASATTCVEGACGYAPLPRGSACGVGVCDGDATEPACLECVSDANCEDDDPCTESTCVDNVCVQTRSCSADAGLPVMDAGPGETTSGGCGCRAASPRPQTTWLMAFLVGAVLLLRRRATRAPGVAIRPRRARLHGRAHGPRSLAAARTCGRPQHASRRKRAHVISHT
ncbi:MAG: MYXO-CTERM sorting domain-containing protein, partial [Phycisphaerales bacterium JB054]